MDSRSKVSGGVNAKRGDLFQTRGLLLYLLIRRLETPDLEVVIEPVEDEDAKFVYTILRGGEAQRVVEFVQYKKRESFKSDDRHPAGLNQDDWREGKITLSDLRKWVVENHPAQSVADILSSDGRAYYTAIVFGKLKDDVKGFAPYLPSMMTFAFPSELLKAFPVDYEHQQDPLPVSSKKPFGTEEIRRRVRLLRFGSLPLVDAQCRQLLEEEPYGCSSHYSLDVVNKLLAEIRKLEGKADERDRRILPGDLEAIIASGRAQQGRWQEVQKLLEQQHADPGEPHWPDSLSWADFEAGRYAHLSEFQVAWEALERDRFVTVCGPAGQGKSTLARYMAYRFLNAHSMGTAYCLRARSGEALDDEISFLRRNIGHESLFIVDDQHLAIDAVERLITTFTDSWAKGESMARLVVTSTITYGRAKLVLGRPISELGRATLIPLWPVTTDRMTGILAGLRETAGLRTPLANEDIAELSKGNLGLALLLAHCAEDFGSDPHLHRLFESRSLRKLITEWILTKLGRPSEGVFFDEEVVPVLMVGSIEIPIPEDFTKAVDELAAAGFLEAEPAFQTNAIAFRPTSRNLALLIQNQYKSSEVSVWNRYLTEYPKRLPAVAEALGYSEHGRSVLRTLLNERFEAFVDTVANPADQLGLDEVSRVLQAANSADRGGSLRLLRGLGAPAGEASSRFFSKFIRPERVRDLSSVTSFLNAAHRIDRYLIRQLAEDQLGERETEFFLGLFRLQSSRIDAIAECLNAIARCSRTFATNLYERWRQSASFLEGVARIEKEPLKLFIWLRFCESIKYVDRDDCYTELERHLSPREVVGAIEKSAEFSRMSFFLLRLRRLAPKLASDILAILIDENRDLLERRLMHEPDLINLASDLHVISRLNRRSAVGLALHVKPGIESLARREDKYDKLGSALDTLQKSIGPAFAADIASVVDRNSILEALKHEKQRFALVGRFLYSLADVSPQLASWFVQRLDYRVYIQRTRTLVVFNYVHIIRGFLAAADPWHSQRPGTSNSPWESLLNQLIDDADLTTEFNRGFKAANSLTEVAFCVAHLLNASINPKNLALLLGFDNVATLRQEILQRFNNENSLMHIVNGLFAAAKYDLDLAIDALQIYSGRLEREWVGDRPSQDPPRKPLHPRNELRFPQGYQSNDLVDVGNLLRVATAIDPPVAGKLAKQVNLGAFSKYAASEANFGRSAVFLRGLHEASRKLARQFAAWTCNEERWTRQYHENELLDNVIHYARALALVSRARAGDYVRFIVEHFKDEIERQLEIEANLTTVANWLRVLPVCGKDFAQQHAIQMSAWLLSTADYDTRLRQLLEATEALAECGNLDLAKEFAERAVGQASQIRSIHALRDWIVVFHKTLRIGRELKLPDFPRRILSELDNWYFISRVVNFERDPLLLAYAYYLLRSTRTSGWEELKARQSAIIDEMRSERRVVIRALGLILAEAPLDLISETARSAVWRQPWERGLAALMFDNLCAAPENPFVDDWISSVPGADGFWRDELSEHAGNLEYGLTLHLAAMSALPAELLASFRTAALERASDESVGAVRWLLEREPGPVDLTNLEHYSWVWLKDTVLRATYLAWESELEGAADSAALKRERVRDLGALLS